MLSWLILTFYYSHDNTSSPWSKIPWSECNLFLKKSLALRLYAFTKAMWFASNLEDLLFIHYCVQWIDFNTFFLRRQHFKSMVRNTLIWIQFFCKKNFTDSSFSWFHEGNAACGNIEDLLVVHYYAGLIDFNILLLTRQHFESMVKNTLIWVQFIS
jgi:hypothetical protein